ncbi:MAG: hypothetical protein QF886_03375 [Planctomycetota bacterium]|nr:hypothetical protein [Planctomycetota bacterium]
MRQWDQAKISPRTNTSSPTRRSPASSTNHPLQRLRDRDRDKDRGKGKGKDRDRDRGKGKDKDRGEGKDKDRGEGKDKDRDSNMKRLKMCLKMSTATF